MFNWFAQCVILDRLHGKVRPLDNLERLSSIFWGTVCFANFYLRRSSINLLICYLIGQNHLSLINLAIWISYLLRVEGLERFSWYIILSFKLILIFIDFRLLSLDLLIIWVLQLWFFITWRVLCVYCLLFGEWLTACCLVFGGTILFTTEIANVIPFRFGFIVFGSTILFLNSSVNLCFLVYRAINFLNLGKTWHLLIDNATILCCLFVLLTSTLPEFFIWLFLVLQFSSLLCHLTHFHLLKCEFLLPDTLF